MKLVIIRHGAAGDSHQWEAEGRDDRLRPLTPDGRKEMQRVAAQLLRLVPRIDVLATSPLVRAAETAKLVGSAYATEALTLEALTPDGSPNSVVRWLRAQAPDHTVGLVGHEPQLSTLTGYRLTGRAASFLDLKKGGACMLDLRDSPEPGRGTLEWLLGPRELGRLGAGA